VEAMPKRIPETQRSALVTGASSGIGLAAARLLSQRGYAVAMVARCVDRLEAARLSVEQDGTASTLAVAADLSTVDGVQHVIDVVTAQWGHLDVVFANVGGPHDTALRDIDGDDFDAVIAANVKSVFFTAVRALPVLRLGASLIVTSSVAQDKGRPGDPLYSASKAAVRSLVRTLALHEDFLRRRVRVNAVTPGTIATPLTTIADPELRRDIDDYVRSAVPMGRWGTADEVAQAVVFLAGEEASYITGTEIVVDGGLAQT
jgi:NAD(P)-dependent dehydrogenase (short-subunit alcohol dehydrogenase family)